MKIIIKLLITTLLSVIITTSLTVAAKAAERCEVQYGGQTICRPIDVELNKKVVVPKEAWAKLEDVDEKQCKANPNKQNCRVRDNFVLTDNYKFAPEQEVEFEITIKNVSNKTFNEVEIRDTLPEFLEPVDGSTKEKKFKFNNFKPEETKTVTVRARVVSANKLPKSQNIICDGRVTNRAVVITDGSLEQGSDTAQVCVSKEKKLARLPETGSNMVLIALTYFSVVGASGLYLLRRIAS